MYPKSITTTIHRIYHHRQYFLLLLFSSLVSFPHRCEEYGETWKIYYDIQKILCRNEKIDMKMNGKTGTTKKDGFAFNREIKRIIE